MKGKKWIHRGFSCLLSLAMITMTLTLTQKEGIEIKAASNTKVYNSGSYTLKDVTITGNSGESAVKINGNVTLTIEGTVTLRGGNAGYGIGAGAGIEVPEGSTLTLKGTGNLIVYGGNASNGQDGLRPDAKKYIDKEKKIVYYPEFQKYGQGGGGAGAGIGSKGSDNANTVLSTGTIQIADKNLMINATGGHGGTLGGKGGDGGEHFCIDEKQTDVGTFLSRNQTVIMQGGYGGGGGGGAGYPAAGIGSGGAAGSNGGSGGSGGVDYCQTSLVYAFIAYVGTTGWWTAGGGGGGAGGKGFVNGGGGGGGATAVGSYNPEFGGFLHPQPTYGGKGGASNDFGKVAEPASKTYDGHTGTSGQGGSPRGTGGPGGTGEDEWEKTRSGDNSGQDGKKNNTGSIILSAGSLTSTSGGGNAQDIGIGDGNGEASSSFTILGGSLDPNSKKFTIKGNNVYPITVRPSMYVQGSNVKTNVKVNGNDGGITRFFPSTTDGSLTLWLPNGTYEVQVANANGIYDNVYHFTVNGSALTPQPDERDTVIDLSNGSITFSDSSYTQGGNIGAYSKGAIVHNSGGTNNTITYTGSSQHTLTLENTNISQLNLGNAQVKVVAMGTESTISKVDITGYTSNITFEGDEESILNIDTIQSNGEKVSLDNYPYEFISELVVSAAKDEATAKKQLTNLGYTVYDLNINQGGSRYVYMGYKKTKDPKEAIRDIKIYNYNKKSPYDGSPLSPNTTITFDGKEYKNMTGAIEFWNLGYPLSEPPVADINYKNGRDHLFIYTSKDPSLGDPIYGLAHMTYPYNNPEEGPYPVYYDNFSANANSHWVLGKKDNEQTWESKAYSTNHGNKNEIYILIGYITANVNTTEVAPYYKISDGNANITNNNVYKLPSDAEKAKKHAGSITMNSKGKVVIGKISAPGQVEKITNGRTMNPDTFYGTPSIIVNQGYMVLQNYLDGTKLKDTTKGTGTVNMGLDPMKMSPVNQFPPAYQMSYTQVDYRMGNNKLGDVTVNGGTLQIGNDGNGAMSIPSAFTSGSYTKPVTTVKAGGNLLSKETSSLASGRIKVEITGLPKNNRLSLIERSDQSGYLGDYTNFDATTNENGNFITYVTNEDNGKYLKFADEAGNAYQYKITVSNGSASASKVSLPALSTMTSADKPIKVYSKYIVHGGDLYAHSESQAVTLNCNATDIELVDRANLILNTTAQRTISSITGNGNLTLQGNGINLTGELSVPMTTIKSGCVKFMDNQVRSIVKILGGSVETNSPLKDAQDASGAVYRAKIADRSATIKVDGKDYAVYLGTASITTMNLYLPEKTEIVQVGNNIYYLKLEGNEFKVTKQLTGDGVINLSKGDAEILNDEQYVVNGQIYKKSTSTPYKVQGTSHHSLTISGGTSEITLDNVNINSTTGSPIDIKAGTNVKLKLSGNNTLQATNKYPAIHVPETASLTISGTGKLNATGGSYAAAIGGGLKENNGLITISGGTLDLTGGLNEAVGAGSDGTSKAGSIIITGGSVNAVNTSGGNAFGTTPKNANGDDLTRLIMTVTSASSVSVDGIDYHINTLHDDGNLYLYVVSGKHSVKASGSTYQVIPLNIGSVENGSLNLSLIDKDGNQTPLANGEMVIEGSKVALDVDPIKGYGIKDGPTSGTYTVKEDDGKLILYPQSGVNKDMDLSDWTTLLETSQDGKNSQILGLEKDIETEGSSYEELSLGVSQSGTSVVTLIAKGKGVKAEIVVNGEVKKTMTLSDENQTMIYEWASNEDTVSVRLIGNGTVVISSIFMSKTIGVEELKAEFQQTVTLSLIQPGTYIDEDGVEQKAGYIRVEDKDGKEIVDRNPSEQGIQLFSGENVKVRYMNYNQGNVFDGFTVTKGSSAITSTDNPMELTIDQDMSIESKFHQIPSYTIVIPETIALDDEGKTGSITASELRNMGTTDTVKVIVKNGITDHKLTLTRDGATNTLLVPVNDGTGKAVENGSEIVKFTGNNTTPTSGGMFQLGKPQGERKAGSYSGNLVFEIIYQKGN